MKPSFATSAFAILALAMVAAPAASRTLSWNPGATTASVGSIIELELVISGLGDGTALSLSTFDIDFLFDPTVISLDSVLFGDPLLGDQLDLGNIGSTTSVLVSTPGAVNLFELSFDSALALDTQQGSNFTLARVRALAVAPGFTSLTLQVNALGDALGDPLPLDSVLSGSISIVPEPSTRLNFATGILGFFATGVLGSASRRRKQRPGIDGPHPLSSTTPESTG